MVQSKITAARKKKIKALLSMMNKQNQRLIPVVPPLVEMMDLVTTEEELDYLLQMGTHLHNYEKALKASGMSAYQFQSFFDTMKRKGLVHIEYDETGKEEYRLNAIAVGWYEAGRRRLAAARGRDAGAGVAVGPQSASARSVTPRPCQPGYW